MIIEIKNLRRNFGRLEALRDISFNIERGEIFGLLGPNGAGKSTTIKILVTLLKAHGGKVLVNGYDVNRHKTEIRRSIGIIFQDPSLDERLTARENLYFHARLYHVPPAEIKGRIEDALELVGLAERKRDLVLTFSGGMKRRLEIARGIIHTPSLLFLDEPTLGLDPQTRRHLWSYIKKLNAEKGVTIVLTTHYMEEAEICGRVAIIDQGRIIALDRPPALKNMIKGDTISLLPADTEKTLNLLKNEFSLEPEIIHGFLRFQINESGAFLKKLYKKAGDLIREIEVKKPTLEDVFIRLTGRTIREEQASLKDKMRNIVKRRRGMH